ncbi:phosphoglycerate mutase [Paraliobacillus quinghaiensis]|uniref:Phosphoglycerate mutase n=1 Tax=Paraliobacillus quinghaiensis TaxID=470815 RepID=A0A917TI82_9BACI|nr:histidine phosphatase family protein [Paraliobacillus quinghaiensis]GGM23371.1 phosphoglycerate mutase [Paraliobacillus quinghaiensis]
MKRLIMIRHCQAESQHKDAPLTKSGVNQAHRLAEFLNNNKQIKLDRIITSPFMRAIETIRPYADHHNISIEKDRRLQERLLSDQPIDDWLDVLEKSFLDFDFRLPGGESSNDALKRGIQVLNEALQDQDNEQIAIVTHGNLLSILLSEFDKEFGFYQWKTLKNPDVFLIEKDIDSYRLEHIW